MRRKTEQEISDEVAAQSLRHHGKSRPEPTHPAMDPDAEDDANATDAAPDDDEDWDEERSA